MKQDFEYFVMDGRARFDTDRAVVLEACGRRKPGNKSLSRDWSGMGAVLVRAPVLSGQGADGSTCGEFEYLRDIE